MQNSGDALEEVHIYHLLLTAFHALVGAEVHAQAFGELLLGKSFLFAEGDDAGANLVVEHSGGK